MRRVARLCRPRLRHFGGAPRRDFRVRIPRGQAALIRIEFPRIFTLRKHTFDAQRLNINFYLAYALQPAQLESQDGLTSWVRSLSGELDCLVRCQRSVDRDRRNTDETNLVFAIS